MTRVIVARRLPPPVESRLSETYGAALNADDHAFTRAQLAAALCEADALCPTITDRIDADLIATPGRRVRVIANFGAGVEHIDLDATRAAGIVVTNTPGALTEATAELAILLMLMATRRASEGERELRGGHWAGWRPMHLIGTGLAGRTLGLVGFGRIAQATAAKARGLGMRIAYHSRSTALPIADWSCSKGGASALPQPAAALSPAINALERDDDLNGIWRRYVNTALAGYARLWARIDRLALLAPPGFDAVLGWRREQERGLRRDNPGGTGVMSDAALDRFVQHYERLTRHILAEMPNRADLVVALDDHRRATSIARKPALVN